MTKNQIKSILERHNQSNNYSLQDCYTNYSVYKARAMAYCYKLFQDKNGYDFRILGYNCMSFSVGFYFNDENGNKKFMYITKAYDRVLDCE